MPLSPRAAALRRVAVPLTAAALVAATGSLVAAEATSAPTSSMSAARASHNATVLPGGAVLVSGGQGANFARYLRSTEVYRPSTRTWERVGPLALGRDAAATATLGDDRVVVTGGLIDTEDQVTASVEVYDDTNGTWSATTPLLQVRYQHTATTLPDGRVLVTGGTGLGPDGWTDLTSSEIFDPGTEEWSPTDSLVTPRLFHTATVLADGSVLVVGGSDGTSSGYLRRTEIFDPVTGEWTTAGPVSTGRAGHTASLMGDGTVLVTGGYSDGGTLATSEVYDPTTRTWSKAAPLSAPRKWHSATALADGRVLVAGGQKALPALVYSPVTKTWRSAGPLTAFRAHPTVTALSDGTALVAGGTRADETYLKSAEIVTPPAAPAPIVDTDGDGVADGKDNCPAIANGSQADADSDETGDLCESEHARSITLTGAHQQVSGVRRLVLAGKVSVADSMTGCRSGRDVVLARLDPATSQWKQVAAPATASDGSYRAVLRDQTGRYRAQVLEETITRAGFTSTCSAAGRGIQHKH